MKRLLLGIALTILASVPILAQQFGGFPPSVKWKQINTDTARIIFPAAVDSEAQEIAVIIHKVMMTQPNSLGGHVRKINIILHNNTTLANGYVALGPFRSEYYLIPGSDIFEFGANPWYKELAVHEFRHVQQYSNFNRGITKVGSILLGQQGQEFFNALVIPDWFWEGDAVHAETSLTTQGRGRTPHFFNGYRSLWREGRNYNWMKLRNGSLKDYVPDHYDLGYLLVNYGYLKYGDDFWKKVTHDAAAYKGLVYPLQHAIKNYSGVDYKTFRREALQYYSHDVAKKRTNQVKRATVTNYYFPQYIGEDSLLYLKSSYRKLPAFYVKNKSGEHKLRLANISNETWFSYRNGTIAYTAYEANPRWSLIDYNSIYLYDLKKGRQTKITARAKYFIPDISPSGEKIIAVLVEPTTETSLRVLDRSGKVLQNIQSLNHSRFVHPRFIDENNIVVTERLINATMQMTRIDLATGSREVLIAPTSALIGYPFVSNGSVYFVSSVAGTDDIYSINLSDKKIFQLESGETGKYYPSVYRDTLVWSAFTSNGLLMQMKKLPASNNLVGDNMWKQVSLPYPVADATPTSNVLNTEPRRFPERKYKQGTHLFNFHSWRPDYSDPEFTMSLFSDNVMNTFSNEIYYRYNQNETSHAFGFNSSYGAWFPVINAGAEYIANRTFHDSLRTIDYNQTEIKLGYNIPLSFTRGTTYKFLNLGSDYVLNQTWLAHTSKDSSKQTYSYLRHFISWAQYLPTVQQHIYPKFGYTVSGEYRHLLTRSGFQFLGMARLFLPSIANHSIVLSGSWQETDTSNVIFSNHFANSRGYDEYYFSRMWIGSVNYHFPIAYPDFGFANIYYLQRLRGNVFYDFTKVYSRKKTASRNLRSVGAELYFDSKFWNELPVSFGVRASYLLDNGFTANDKKGKTWFEFILPLNLIPN
ncbi:MAG: hypothetical protein ACXVBZ_02545 [Flavisolibacter sp.]